MKTNKICIYNWEGPMNTFVKDYEDLFMKEHGKEIQVIGYSNEYNYIDNPDLHIVKIHYMEK